MRAIIALESIANSLSRIQGDLNEVNSMERIRKEAMCKHDLERIEKDSYSYKRAEFLKTKKSLGHTLTAVELADLETYSELLSGFLINECDIKLEGGNGC